MIQPLPDLPQRQSGCANTDYTPDPISDVYANRHDEPGWEQSDVPQQIRRSLEKSRAWGKPWPLAWHACLQNLALPHDRASRGDWYSILSQPDYVRIWQCAYLGVPYAVDVDALHAAIEEPDEVWERHGRTTAGSGGRSNPAARYRASSDTTVAA